MPVAWAARRRGEPVRRLSGTDGMTALSDWGVGRGLRHYLYGATDPTLSAMRANLERIHPGIEDRRHRGSPLPVDPGR